MTEITSIPKPLTELQVADNGHPHRFTIVRLRPDISAHWPIMGDVLTRLTQFIHRLSLESPPAVVHQYVRTYWANGNEQVAVWAGLDGDKVIGHALAMMEVSWGIPYGMIVQLEVDRPYASEVQQRKWMLAELIAWAKAQGATCLKMLTPRTPEVWTRLAGFHVDKVLMKRSLDDNTT